MTAKTTLATRLLRARGQAATEYALISGWLIGGVVVGAAAAFPTLNRLFNTLQAYMDFWVYCLRLPW
jgi:hypothetical protein